MSVRIERGLRERFERFTSAAREGNAQALQTSATARGASSKDAPPSKLDELRKAAASEMGSDAQVRTLVSGMESVLPNQLWASVIANCRGSSGLKEAREELARLGLSTIDDARYGRALSRLGMLAVSVPPLVGMLDRLGSISTVGYLGDGDRKGPLAPVAATEGFEVNSGRQAVVRAMMADRATERFLDQPRGLVRVAIVDSGIDDSSGAFGDRIVDRVDLGVNSQNFKCPSGHGTHVAGIVGGDLTFGERRVAGVAPFVDMMDVLVFEPDGAPMLAVVAGIGYAVDNGADIINLSVGSFDPVSENPLPDSLAVEEAMKMGVLVCVSAGNLGERGAGTITSPGDAPGAITVAATDYAGNPAPFSSIGPVPDTSRSGAKPDLAAPGINILSIRSRYSTAPSWVENGETDHRLTLMSGTSMASPVIAGLAAAGLAHHRRLGNDANGYALAGALKDSSVKLVPVGDDRVGRGTPQVEDFVRELGGRARPMAARRAAVSVPDSSIFKEGIPEEAESPGAMSQAASVQSGAGGAGVTAANLTKTVKDELERYYELEGAFVNGVKENVGLNRGELFSRLVAPDEVPLDNSQVACDIYKPTDREHAIARKYKKTKLDFVLDLDHLPADLGVVLKLRSDAYRKLGDAEVYVWVRSLALTAALGRFEADGTDNGAGPLDASLLQDELAKRNPRKGAAHAMALFSPVGWDEAALNAKLPGTAWASLLCTDRSDKAVGWCSVDNMDSAWRTSTEDMSKIAWYALTPMASNRRTDQCIELLDSHPKLLQTRGLLRVSEFAAEEGLPASVGLDWVKGSLEATEDKRFALYDVDGTWCVQREQRLG